MTKRPSGIQPEYAIASASEHRSTARIGASRLGVMPAIDLDHSPMSGRREVSDEAQKQRHLTAKHHAELMPAKASPEQSLGRRL